MASCNTVTDCSELRVSCQSDSTPVQTNDEKAKSDDVNTKSSDDALEKSDDVKTDPSDQPQRPKGVSAEMWQKFQRLKSQREKVCKKTTEKRIKRLQDDVLQKVQREMGTEEELQALRHHGVAVDSAPDAKKPKMADNTKPSTSRERREAPAASAGAAASGRDEKPAETWSDVQRYLGCNDHLRGLDKGRHAPKSGLEEELEAAVARGQLVEAEQLSDQLAARQFGTKITEAIDAKRYAEDKQEEEKKQKEKKKKKLQWGFTEKHRWETKSNM